MWNADARLASPAGQSTSTSSGEGGSCTIHGCPPANACALVQYEPTDAYAGVPATQMGPPGVSPPVITHHWYEVE